MKSSTLIRKMQIWKKKRFCFLFRYHFSKQNSAEICHEALCVRHPLSYHPLSFFSSLNLNSALKYLSIGPLPWSHLNKLQLTNNPFLSSECMRSPLYISGHQQISYVIPSNCSSVDILHHLIRNSHPLLHWVKTTISFVFIVTTH